MIRFQEVSYTYLSQGSEEVQSPSMDHISFHIPKGQWHAVEVIEPSVILEVKDGPYMPLQPEDTLD